MKKSIGKLKSLLGFGDPVSANPMEEAEAAYGSRDFDKAQRLLHPLAEQGDVAAQSLLALMYSSGEGVPQDAAISANWMRLAAEQSNVPLFQQIVGNNYRLGQGVPQDANEAFRWLRKAADQGFAPAQFDLGELCEDGIDGTPDYVEAACWYRRAAEQPSSNWIGFGPANAAAHSNDERSGDQQLAAAQMRLGLLLFQGKGQLPRRALPPLSIISESCLRTVRDCRRIIKRRPDGSG